MKIVRTMGNVAGTGSRLLTVAALGALSLFNAACGAAPETSEQLDAEANAGVATEAIGQAACATLAPYSTATGYIRNFITAIDYTGGTCANSWIFDITSYNANHHWTDVAWYDPLTTSASCTSAQVDAQLYVKSGSSWVKQGGQLTARGVWGPAPFNSFACTNPDITWTTAANLVSGKSYRIVATAHTVGHTTTHALIYNSETIVH